MSSVILEKIHNIFRKSEEKIEPNIEKLPKKIGRHKVVIQYAPPKWLSPSEVSFLYYKRFNDTDLDAILYDWAYKWFISISGSDKSKEIKKLKDLDSVKEYERYCRHSLFGFHDWVRKMHFKSLAYNFYYNKVGLKILDYCKMKWRLIYESTKPDLTNFFLLITVWPFLLMIWFALSSIAVGGSILWWIVFLIIASYALYRIFTNDGVWIRWIKSITLTDEWEKLLAHIYWYKYYLERCEEEQFKKLMQEDPLFIDKTLPYIIALRLNPYFLKNQSIFHDESLDITTIAE